MLICCVIPLVLTNLFGNQILIPSGNEKRFSQSVFVGMWINIILNSILIPILGAVGAAIGTLATECWNVIWMSGGAREYRKLLLKKIKLWKYLIVYIVCFFVAILLKKNVDIILFWKLFFSGVSFMGVCYLMLFIEKEPVVYSLCLSLRSAFLKKIKRK